MLGRVAYTCNPRIWEAEAVLRAQGQPVLRKDFQASLSAIISKDQNKQTKKPKTGRPAPFCEHN
jgi:hypothetical protein